MSERVRGEIALQATVGDVAAKKRFATGLYTLSGGKAKGTKRPIGVAFKIRELNNQLWFAGTALYKLDPPARFFYRGALMETSYVIVCSIPESTETQRMTLVFAANGFGNLFADDGDIRAVEIGPRLIGCVSHRRVLSALQGGYGIDLSVEKPRSKRDKSRKLPTTPRPV